MDKRKKKGKKLDQVASAEARVWGARNYVETGAVTLGEKERKRKREREREREHRVV